TAVEHTRPPGALDPDVLDRARVRQEARGALFRTDVENARGAERDLVENRPVARDEADGDAHGLARPNFDPSPGLTLVPALHVERPGDTDQFNRAAGVPDGHPGRVREADDQLDARRLRGV